MAAVKAVNSRNAAGKGVEGESVKEEQAPKGLGDRGAFLGGVIGGALDLALPAPTRAAVLRTITKRGPEQIVEVIAACLVDRLRLLNDLFSRAWCSGGRRRAVETLCCASTRRPGVGRPLRNDTPAPQNGRNIASP